MLVLSRKPKQSIIISDSIEIHIIDIKGDQVKIGILAPKNIIVHRKEVYEEIRAENLKASQSVNQKKFKDSLKDIFKS